MRNGFPPAALQRNILCDATARRTRASPADTCRRAARWGGVLRAASHPRHIRSIRRRTPLGAGEGVAHNSLFLCLTHTWVAGLGSPSRRSAAAAASSTAPSPSSKGKDPCPAWPPPHAVSASRLLWRAGVHAVGVRAVGGALGPAAGFRVRAQGGWGDVWGDDCRGHTNLDGYAAEDRASRMPLPSALASISCPSAVARTSNGAVPVVGSRRRAQ